MESPYCKNLIVLKPELHSSVSTTCKFWIFIHFFFSFHLDIEQKRAQKWKWKYPGDINLHEIPLSTWGVKISEIVKHFEEKVSIDTAKKRLTQQLYWFTTEEKSVKKDHKNWVKETKKIMHKTTKTLRTVWRYFQSKKVKCSTGFTFELEGTVCQCLEKKKYSYCIKWCKRIVNTKDCRKT